MAAKTAGIIDRYTSLIERGWLSVLSHVELKVWLVYLKHTNRSTGHSYPGDATVGEEAGVGKTHVGEIRKTLVAHGLLSVVQQGGGRGRMWIVEAVVPSESEGGEDTVKGSEQAEPLEAIKVPKKVPDLTPKGSEKGSEIDRALNKDEQVEQDVRTSSPPSEVMLDGDALDDRVRRHIQGHRMLPTWDPKTHANLRRLVEAEGWDRACELVDKGIAAGKSFPVGWALGAAQAMSRSRAAATDVKPLTAAPTGIRNEDWD